MTTPRLFHIIGITEAGVLLKRGGSWSPESLESEGFVHLSYAHQVAGSLNAHYSDTAELVLIEIAQPKSGADLKLEVSRNGAKFPHLYRSLCRADVLRSWRLTRGPRGWHPPLFAETSAKDDPIGLDH